MLFKGIYLLGKVLFFIYLLSSTASLYAYDDDILNIYSKMLPRFILMSSQKEKISDKIEICVLHDAIDDRDAALLMDKVNNTPYIQGNQAGDRIRPPTAFDSTLDNSL